MEGLYIAKMFVPSALNMRGIYETDEVSVNPDDYTTFSPENDMVINWNGTNTRIHSSLGSLSDTTKLKVYYEHPRVDELCPEEQTVIEDGLGQLFIEELFREKLGLEYSYNISWFDEQVTFTSGDDEITLTPGDSFTRANGEVFVFIGTKNRSTIVFETESGLGDIPIDEVHIDNCSIQASPTVMAPEYAMKTSESKWFVDNE